MIKKFLVSLLILFIAVLLQTTLFSYMKFLQVKPDLALVLLVFVALYQGSTAGQLAGFFTGLSEDVLSTVPLGVYAFTNTVIGFVIGLFKDKIDINSVVFPLILIPVVSIVKYVFIIVLSLLFTIPLDLQRILTWRTLLEIGYNIILGLLVFVVLYLIRQKIQDRVNSHVAGF